MLTQLAFVAVAASLLVSGDGRAHTPQEQASTQSATDTDSAEQEDAFISLKRALVALGMSITTERYVDSGSGDRDLEVVSETASYEALIAAVRTTYSKRAVLAGGARIAGYAKADRRGSFLITFRLGVDLFTVELRPHAPSGVHALIGGMSRDRGFKPDGPLRPLPPAVVPRVRPR